MTSRDFVYWLQGYFEVAKPKTIGEAETEMIRRHLALVFIHEIDPSIPDPSGKLQLAHDGKDKLPAQPVFPQSPFTMPPPITMPPPFDKPPMYRC